MKITHRKITASTSSVSVPTPYDKYYTTISDEEFEYETGMPATPYLVEEIDGYNIEHLAYVKAKPEYEDALGTDGHEYAELVREGDEVFVAYVSGDKVYNLFSLAEIRRIVEEEGDFYDM